MPAHQSVQIRLQDLQFDRHVRFLILALYPPAHALCQHLAHLGASGHDVAIAGASVLSRLTAWPKVMSMKAKEGTAITDESSCLLLAVEGHQHQGAPLCGAGSSYVQAMP